MVTIFTLLLPILIIVIPVIIIVFVLISKKQAKEEEGGKNVIKTIYSYLVLFATLMMVIGGGIGIFMSTADILFPDTYYQTFEQYKKSQSIKPETGESIPDFPILSDAELRSQYDSIVQEEKNKQVNRAKNALFKSFGWVLIPLPVFLYFQRRIPKKDNA